MLKILLRASCSAASSVGSGKSRVNVVTMMASAAASVPL